MFDGKHLACTRKAGLNFVSDEKDAVAVEDLLHFLEVVAGRNKNPSFTHHRFCNECSYIVGSGKTDHIFEGLRALASTLFGVVGHCER